MFSASSSRYRGLVCGLRLWHFLVILTCFFRRTGMICSIIWASTRENLSSGVCEQDRRRPACASAQSDQRLCYSRFVKHHIQACYKRSFIFLASLCSWAGLFESHFVGNPEDRFSRDEAHLYVNIAGVKSNSIRNDFTNLSWSFIVHSLESPWVSIRKSQTNSRIKPRMYVRRSTMYEKLHFISRNWRKEK